ncbi:hypothetical protein RRG08_044943 [Elysia crispata]|uniref:Uncharacterized protein n=1 Tax=Elysia crispata TaxID=231223 RepID=A0AAE0ZTT4_9GAST|nr:hypothetical protein RRG08_044943 [Elysia crispata]
MDRRSLTTAARVSLTQDGREIIRTRRNTIMVGVKWLVYISINMIMYNMGMVSVKCFYHHQYQHENRECQMFLSPSVSTWEWDKISVPRKAKLKAVFKISGKSVFSLPKRFDSAKALGSGSSLRFA